MIKTITTALLLIMAVPAAAKECTDREAYVALSVVGYINSWKEIYKAFQEFGRCDDAAIAEGFDDVISIQWADHWNRLPEMIKYTKENEQFKAFIFKRVHTEDIPLDRWERIVNKANHHCPKAAREFCREIVKADNSSKYRLEILRNK